MKNETSSATASSAENHSTRKLQRWSIIGGLATAGSTLLNFLREPALTPWLTGGILLAVFCIGYAIFLGRRRIRQG